MSRAHGEDAGEANDVGEFTPRLVTDTVGLIIEANHPAQVLFGRPRRDLVGTSVRDHFAEPARIVAGIDLARQLGDSTDVNLTVIRPASAPTMVSYRARSSADRSTVDVVLYDIGSAKETGPLADEIEFMRAEFISRLSHELRTPLTSVFGYLELLRDEDAGELTPAQRTMVDKVTQSSTRLLEVLNDLLAAAEIQSGAFDANFSRLDLSGLVRDTADGARPSAQARNLVFLTDIADDIEIDGDPTQLRRVTESLLSNAISYSRRGGRLDLSLQRATISDVDWAVLTVADAGIGIPFDEQARVFDRFYRSTLTRHLQTKGIGLGLFIARQAITAHHGTIDLVSVPGEGTTVVVRVPTRQHETSQPSADSG